jgi:hypothetical protein
MEMTNPEQFKQDSYLDLKSVLPADICRVATKYALLKEECEFTPEGADAQVAGVHSVYSDTLMETLLHFLLPIMEKNTGLSLCPTYTYYRVYRPGADLKRHKDRESCEISTTVCLGNNYIVSDPSYNWGMYVDKESTKVSFGPNGEFISGNNPGQCIKQNPGDIIVYRGCDVEHWRDPFVAATGSYQVQAFFHYIDKNGPFYPKFAFDNRPGIGWKHKYKV